MRIVTLSDTHAMHKRVGLIPEGDVLVHAGDLMNCGQYPHEIASFNKWLGDLPHRYKIVIAGNHDRLFESHRDIAVGMLTNAIYLENSGVEIEGFKFWGSPQQPEFFNWAFNVPRGAAIKRYWDLIPNDTDVLITHGPPIGFRDWVRLGEENLGCEELLKAVERVKPQLHVFGHIHGGQGVAQNEHTRFVNAAFVDEDYRPYKREIQYVDLEQPRSLTQGKK